ncbi:MAG: trypsin-like peptidase domain-containing protein [Bacteriovoracaceae bacterium]|nr:trypsin-like peptidase domain-containing protein [Bacteriovoracaceae bacterium]
MLINFKYICLLTILISCFSNTLWGRTRIRTGHQDQDLYARVKHYVYQIKTATDAKSSKASYGTGFVVDKNGLVITNYHVVADALQDEDKNFKIFLVDGDKSIPARIVNISVIHDLALLKVKKKFKNALSISKKPPTQGETIYSIGLPKDLKMSIVKGIYNGVIKSSLYEQILMSSPINSGMSGGPTLNSNVQVVGINVSILLNSQNISFAIPAAHAGKLVKEYLKKGDPDLKNNVDKIIEAQLHNVEKNLMVDMKKNPGDNFTIGNWTFAPPSKSLKCWSQNIKHDKKTYEVTNQTCFLQDGSYVSDSIYSGSYEVQYRIVKNISRNSIQFFNLLRTLYNKGHAFSNAYLKYYDNELISKYDCNEKIVVNKHDIPIKINYCVNGFIKYSKLYRLYVKGVTILNRNDALIFNAKLDGFSKKSMIDFLKYQLSKIKLKNKK